MKTNEKQTMQRLSSNWLKPLKKALGLAAMAAVLFGSADAFAQVGTPPLWNGTAYNDAINSTGADQLHAIGITGRGVSSAVLDTLFDVNHPAYSANIVYGAHYTEGWETNNTAPNGGSLGSINIGVNFVDTADLMSGVWDPRPGADNAGVQHGSHVAGIVASMAPNVGLVLLNSTAQNAAGTAYTTFTDTDALISHAADIASAYNIVSFNGSYGAWTPPYDKDGNSPPEWPAVLNNGNGNADANNPETLAALTKLADAGVVGVFSTGNDSYNNYITSPSAVTGSVPVGAVNSNGLITSFSNQNENIVLLAPGQDVYSSIPAWVDGTGVVHTYDAWPGTSMAAPHVTGGVALIASGARNASNQEILQSMVDSADQIVYDGSLVVSASDYLGSQPVADSLYALIAQNLYGVDCTQPQTVETWRQIERYMSLFGRFYDGTNLIEAIGYANYLADQIDESLNHVEYRFLRVDKAYMNLTEKRTHGIADRIGQIGSLYGDVLDAYARELGGRLDADTAAIFQRLDAQTTEIQADVARRMSPAFLNSTAESAHLGLLGLHRSLGRRTEINRLGQGHNGGSACRPCEPCEPCGPCDSACSPCASACGSGGVMTGGWVEGFGDFSDVDGSRNGAAYDGHFSGVSFGIERTRNDKTWGIFGAYGNHFANGNEGRSEGDWGNVGLYGRLDRKRGFFEGSVAYGYGDYDLNRYVSIPGARFTDSTPGQFVVLDPMWKNARARTHANSVSTRLAGGRDLWKINGWKVGPRGEFSLSYVDFDGYAERGADSLNLRVDRYQTTYLEGGLGLHAGKKFVRGSQMFVASGKIMGMYGGMVGDALSGRFIAGENDFRTEANHIATGWVVPEATLAWNLTEGVVISGTYSGRFGEKYSSNAVAASLNLYW